MKMMMKSNALLLLTQVREAQAQTEREREGRQGQLEDLHRWDVAINSDVVGIGVGVNIDDCVCLDVCVIS